MPAPPSFDELKLEIARRQSDLPRRLRQIAEFVVRNPNEIALGTVAAIAGHAGVQPSSVVRFANAFGYQGFSGLQRVFRSRLVADSVPSYRERIARMRSARGDGGRADDDPSRVLAAFAAEGVASLEHLHDTIKTPELERAVRLLARAERIYLLAQGRSFPVAFYMHYALCRLDLNADLIDGIGGTGRLQARTAAKRDVLVSISFKDYAPDVVDLTNELARRGLPVVAITDGPLSPIAVDAAVAFEIHQSESQSFRSLVAPICLAQSLVVALGHRLAPAARAA